MQDAVHAQANQGPSAEPAEKISKTGSAEALGRSGTDNAWQQPSKAEPQLLKAQEPKVRRQPQLQFAEPSNTSLDMLSQVGHVRET